MDAQQESSRRTFLRRSLTATAGAAGASVLGGNDTAAAAAPPAEIRKITLKVNGRTRTLDLDTRASLLDALRERIGLTGTKKGCNQGACGACTILVDGRRTLACLTIATMYEHRDITTVEGLANGDRLHPVQRAFVEHDGLQCGFCTSGQVMSAVGLLRENPRVADADIPEQMSGNLCRCAAYQNINAAIRDARGDL